MISKIQDIATQLQSAYPKDEAEAMAWWIAEELTGLSRTQLQIGCKDTTNFSNLQEINQTNAYLQEIVTRLLHFEPIQYIFGHTLWCGLDLKVTPATLIPRPETAELVELICKSEIKNLKSEIHILDIGCGSGCIALAVKRAHPEWQVTGIDISAQAIEVAKENAVRNNLDVAFHVADIFSDSIGQNQQYDIVVSNPPYICEREKKDMRINVLEYEPESALFVPDDDPLLFYRRIAELYSHHPSSGTHHPLYLFFEINENYADETAHLLQRFGYTDICITKDIYGKSRIIQARSAS